MRWVLNASNGKNTKLYFRREDTGTRVTLTSSSLAESVKEYTIDSQGLASPNGSIELSQVFSNGTGETNYIQALVPRTKHLMIALGDPLEGEQPAPKRFENAFHHRDHLGNLRVVTDSGGWKQEAYDYYPFGRQIVPYGTSEVGTTTFRFAGLERDGWLGLDYAQARYKGVNDPMFLSPDPLISTSPAFMNRNTYVGGNPLSRTDPTGLEIRLVCTSDGCHYEEDPITVLPPIIRIGYNPPPSTGPGARPPGGGGPEKSVPERAKEISDMCKAGSSQALDYLNSDGPVTISGSFTSSRSGDFDVAGKSSGVAFDTLGNVAAFDSHYTNRGNGLGLGRSVGWQMGGQRGSIDDFEGDSLEAGAGIVVGLGLSSNLVFDSDKNLKGFAIGEQAGLGIDLLYVKGTHTDVSEFNMIDVMCESLGQALAEAGF